MNWHNAFSLIISDLFTDSPYDVDSEYHLSTASQRLDVVVVRRRPGEFQGELPDGMEGLRDHNLISFKSYQESFDFETILELLCYLVLYRKSVSPNPRDRIAFETIQLYGVTSRFPTQLAQQVPLIPIRPGVYDIMQMVIPIRILVLRDLPQTEANAGLELLSASEEQIQYAITHYRQKNLEMNQIVDAIVAHYRGGGILMADPMIAFKKQVRELWFSEMTTEERLAGLDSKEVAKLLPPQDRVEGLQVEERLAGLKAEERLAGLDSKEVAKLLPPQDRLEGIDRKEIAKLLPLEDLIEVLQAEERLSGLSKEQIQKLRNLLEENEANLQDPQE